MSSYPSQAEYAEQVGTVFAVGAPGESAADAVRIELMLDAVIAGIETEGYAPFSLEFVGEGEGLSQATYSLAHAFLGTHEVFLVPVGTEGTAIRYEAVFNVAKESEG